MIIALRRNIVGISTVPCIVPELVTCRDVLVDVLAVRGDIIRSQTATPNAVFEAPNQDRESLLEIILPGVMEF